MVQDGGIVGAVAIVPQVFFYRCRRVTGLQTVDGLMGREIRGKHLFNDVMSFLLRNRPDYVGKDCFYLSFPSLASSIRAHENAGWHKLADFQLYTCFLRVECLERSPRLRSLQPLLRPLWGGYRNLLLAGADDDVRVEEVEEFGEDQMGLMPADKVFGDRTRAMLQWRVVANPRDAMKAFALHDGSGLAGYVVCKVRGRGFEIVDWMFHRPNRRYLASFLAHLYRRDLADSVDVFLFSDDERRAWLSRLGFVRRQFTGAMFVQHLDRAGLPADPAQWKVSYLDSDW